MAMFVLEIGSEEIPSRFLEMEKKELQNRFAEKLEEASIRHGKIAVYATPRRAAVIIDDLDPVQQQKEILITGPAWRIAYSPDNVPTKALEAFLKNNEAEASDIFCHKMPKGDYVAIKKNIGGADSKKLLAEICPEIVRALPFPKRMKWGANALSYARPLHWIVALVDDEIITFQVGPVSSGRNTFGHRVHGHGPFEIKDAQSYFSVIEEKCRVCLDSSARRNKIVEMGDSFAKAIGGRILWNEPLLEEVGGLTEHPFPLLGEFDAKYLEVPREVLLTSMETHQKSFGVESANGQLLPYFLTVLNFSPADKAIVKHGWERVLRARLEDARFFWKTDLQHDFATWLEKLDSVIFIGPLGSMGNKTRRLESLCKKLHASHPQKTSINEADAMRAGRISKADLVSDMVGEFDTLQGIMGGIYALQQKEPLSVAQAVREQYLPSGPKSALPASHCGQILAVADKMDTLVGCFGLNMIPTGTADPNGLRRCALGIIRIAIDAKWDFDLRAAFDAAFELYGDIKWKNSKADTLEKLMEFLTIRLRHYLLDQDIDVRLIDAVLNTGMSNIPDSVNRIDALKKFGESPAFIASATTFKRVDNIIRKQASKENLPPDWDRTLFQSDVEIALGKCLESGLPKLDGQIEKRDYAGAFSQLAEFQPVVDAFFDGVMVMDPSAPVRINRLSMLESLRSRFAKIVDFSALQI